MHYLTLITAEIPVQIEDDVENEAVKKRKKELEKEKQLNPDHSSCITDLMIASCNNLRDTFSRAVASSAESILDPYNSQTEDPDYLEFWDKTQELERAYQQTVDCIRLPEGRIFNIYDPTVFNRFIIRDGKVYERHAGPLSRVGG